jgi:phosphatidylinositol 4-phosphatase
LGTINLPGVYDHHLLVVKDIEPVGALYAANLVYKIKSVCILSDAEPDCALIPCKKHASKSVNTGGGAGGKPKIFENSLFASKTMGKTWDAMKSAGNTIKNTTQSAAQSTTVKLGLKEKDPNREERKINEEIHKIFDDTDSFYYCPTTDMTNNLQRRCAGSEPDDRFFWNKEMLKSIIELDDPDWIMPIIQGFVEVEQNVVVENECLTLALISRRSRYRAGTRYKRRGVDEDGHCANYVETEQILTFRQHQISFTQVRGSVPIYWSQGSVKYRPPPRLDRDEAETQKAFEKHFDDELVLYNKIRIINLVEQSGKERIIGDAYAHHVMLLNSEDVWYVTFDFHEHCRGMCFENVSILIEALAAEAGSMGFHWSDRNGKICDQQAVFRINCIDCLDRTNVVQTALGRTMLESQLVKLGLTVPYAQIPEQIKMTFMMLWANNGDVLSQQYAGTKALKGDFTRTGERKISGMFKDGMNSANR